MAPPIALPETFARAVAGLRSARPRPEIVLEEVGAPQRLAPYAFALSATVLRDDDEVASGRLILLHDPAGHEAWQGTLRLVTYVTAELEVDLAADPLLPGVGWTWLTDALERARGGATGRSAARSPRPCRPGSATWPAHPPPATSRSAPPGRRSTTTWPRTCSAWCALLASTAGLPPPGVTALAERRPAGAA